MCGYPSGPWTIVSPERAICVQKYFLKEASCVAWGSVLNIYWVKTLSVISLSQISLHHNEKGHARKRVGGSGHAPPETVIALLGWHSREPTFAQSKH